MEDPAGRLVFSPDSKRLGYVAQNGNRYFVVVDGKAGPEYPTVSHPRFSPDSRRVAYVAAPGPRRWFGRDDGIPGRIVLDGQEGPLYDEISPAQFSADSEHTAYVVRKGERFLVVLNGKEGEPFDRIDYRTMRFSPAGRRLAYIAEEKGKAILIVDGVRTPARDAVSAPTFSPDGRRFAYVAKDGEKTFAVLEGQELARFDDVDSLGFSPNSERFAYWARTGNNWTAIIDGKAGPQYSGKMDPSAWTDVPVVFSPDSRRVAYAAWKGGSGPPTGFQLCGDSSEGAMFRGIAGAVAVAVVDGIEGPEFQHIFGPVFSQDSTRVGYIGFTSGEFGSIVIDGRAVASDRALPSGLRFSPNGKHVAYSAGPARNGNQSRACLRDTEISVFVDGAESSGYLSVWPAPLKDDALEFVAKKRDGFYRVRQPIAP
jgi:dipeptidyl aminopeptidase/acylaminoacyl peptidase